MQSHDTPALPRTPLESVLTLEDAGPDRFVVRDLVPNSVGAIFGGQYLANVVGAAMHSAPGRVPHVLQAFFLRSGTVQAPLELSVSRIREGRRFAHRSVEVHQGERLLMRAEVSLHEGDGAPLKQPAMPAVPPPEELLTLEELIEEHRAAIPGDRTGRIYRGDSVRVKPVNGAVDLLRPPSACSLAFWMRPVHAVPADDFHRYCTLAYLSDYWIGTFPASVMSDCAFAPEAPVLSLNQTMWFHTQPTAAEWILYALDIPVSNSSLGLGRGGLYSRDGVLMASVMQESLLP